MSAPLASRVSRVIGWVLVAAAFGSLVVTVPVGVPDAPVGLSDGLVAPGS